MNIIFLFVKFIKESMCRFLWQLPVITKASHGVPLQPGREMGQWSEPGDMWTAGLCFQSLASMNPCATAALVGLPHSEWLGKDFMYGVLDQGDLGFGVSSITMCQAGGSVTSKGRWALTRSPVTAALTFSKPAAASWRQGQPPQLPMLWNPFFFLSFFFV